MHASSSASADESAMTCRVLHQCASKCDPLMITPPEVDLRVEAPPAQTLCLKHCRRIFELFKLASPPAHTLCQHLRGETNTCPILGKIVEHCWSCSGYVFFPRPLEEPCLDHSSNSVYMGLRSFAVGHAPLGEQPWDVLQVRLNVQP